MDMPRPGEPHRRLQELVGSWVGKERLSPSPWDPVGGEAVGRIENRAALDGFVVVQDYGQERNGAVTFRGHGIFSWDAPRGSYVLHWFDSMGMPPNEYRGNFDGNVLSLSNQGPQGHSRAVFDLGEPGRYVFRMDFSQDGSHWQTLMEGQYSRQ